VALIGVPRTTGLGAFNVLENLIKFGYRGKVFPVNPKLDSILGRTAYPDVNSLPEVPDLAVVAVGREKVLDVVRNCADRGIKRAVVVTQGFADADEKGRALQEELTRLAKASGLRIVGPNTLGVINHFAPFSTSFVDIPRDEHPWPVSVICQSGVFHASPESFTGKIGKGMDIGNACDLGFADCLRYFAHDPQTDLIVIHMEGTREGRGFLKTAAEISEIKPVLVLKTGKSETGGRIALSHTGSMVGEMEVYRAAFKKAGLLEVEDPEELIDAVKALLFLPPMRRNRLGLISFTGAGAIMMADACQTYGLEISKIPPGGLMPLQDLAPDWFKVSNPMDIWPPIMWGGYEKAMDTALRLMLERNDVDGVVLISGALGSPLHADLDPEERLKERPYKDSKPVTAWLYGDGANEMAVRLEKNTGVMVYPSIPRAVRAISFPYRYHLLKERKRMPVEDIPPVAHKEEVLLGVEALKLLEEMGIPVPPHRMIGTEEDATDKAGELGYPLVLKLISPMAPHKTDIGGVVLNIKGPEELKEAIHRMKSRAAHAGLSLEGFLLQPMAEGIELIAGIKRDPQFGPVISFGMGGIYTEVLKDFTLGIAPIGEDEALEMIDGLKARAVLEGIRGRPGVDKVSLVHLLLALSNLAMETPQIRELDINPVMVGCKGCLAVDCRVVLG